MMNIYDTTAVFNKVSVSLKTYDNWLVLSVKEGFTRCKIYFRIRTLYKEENSTNIFVVSPKQFEPGQDIFAKVIYDKFVVPNEHSIRKTSETYLFSEEIEKIFEDIYNYIKM